MDLDVPTMFLEGAVVGNIDFIPIQLFINETLQGIKDGDNDLPCPFYINYETFVQCNIVTLTYLPLCNTKTLRITMGKVHMCGSQSNDFGKA